jgi:hypothetical protein
MSSLVNVLAHVCIRNRVDVGPQIRLVSENNKHTCPLLTLIQSPHFLVVYSNIRICGTMAVFWGVAVWSSMYIDRRCRGCNYLHNQVHSFTGAYNPGWTFGLPFRGFLITHIQTHGTIPLDEWSARRRDLYLHRTTQHINNRQTSMPRAGFEPAPQLPSGRRPTP